MVLFTFFFSEKTAWISVDSWQKSLPYNMNTDYSLYKQS